MIEDIPILIRENLHPAFVIKAPYPHKDSEEDCETRLREFREKCKQAEENGCEKPENA